jgi:glycosyltransferase involved in cell wall biosynthesis
MKEDDTLDKGTAARPLPEEVGATPPPYPHVLVFGCGFDGHTGGGITLTNLFRGWPRERLAVADFTPRADNAKVAVSEYQLGTSEQTWRWPFSLVSRQSRPSGIVVPDAGMPSGAFAPDEPTPPGEREKASSAFYWMVSHLGDAEMLQHSTLSTPLISWVRSFAPDVVYCQLGSLHAMRLTRQLYDSTRARLAIHIMDDWPTTLYGGSMLGPSLRALVDREFRDLLALADVRLVISRAMAREYASRYGFEFGVFHNCIDVGKWKAARKRTWHDHSPFTVAYSGRIGWDALSGFDDVCAAVEAMNGQGVAAEFHVYSPHAGTSAASRLLRHPHTKVLPPPDHSGLPEVLASADVVVFTSDFEGWGRRYARLSMPTKIPAYMASGTPVLLHAPADHATCQWAQEAGWAVITGRPGSGPVLKALLRLAGDPALRERLGRRATTVVERECDERSVRPAFATALAGATALPVVPAPRLPSALEASQDIWPQGG